MTYLRALKQREKKMKLNFTLPNHKKRLSYSTSLINTHAPGYSFLKMTFVFVSVLNVDLKYHSGQLSNKLNKNLTCEDFYFTLEATFNHFCSNFHFKAFFI